MRNVLSDQCLRFFDGLATREDMDLTINHTKNDLIADFKTQGPAIIGRDHNASTFSNLAMNIFHVCHLSTGMSLLENITINVISCHFPVRASTPDKSKHLRAPSRL